MTDNISLREAERALAIGYVPAKARRATNMLFALDAQLAGIVRTTREPIVGQMRLTWWYEALEALDTRPAPAEPILRALQAEVLPCGVRGAALATMIDGWEVLLDGEAPDKAALALHARARGGALFGAAAAVIGANHAAVRAAGEGWAAADLAVRLTDTPAAAGARALATDRLATVFHARWPAPLRALGALALLARFDLMTPSPPHAGPRRIARLLRHRLTGY